MEHFPLIDRLHTDVLEEKYGAIHAKVLKHDDLVRESHLVDAKDISRTYALTFFPESKANAEIKRIDSEIRAGGLIGVTFRTFGYSIRKNVVDVFVLELPEWLKNDFKTNENYAKARMSEFYAKKEGVSPAIYGDVLEVYTPDFRPPIVNQFDNSQINPSTEELIKVGFSIDNIWTRLGDNNWTDVQVKYDKARVDSLQRVFEWRKKIDAYLKNH
jgi:hypothetical protein